MTTEEKINLLISYGDMASLSSEHFAVLKRLSFDDDSFVRSLVAPPLVFFVNDEAKQILLVLARDNDELVRTEAYDSLSVFAHDDVESFLEKAMQTEKDELARSYAISSWADVVVSLGHDTTEKKDLLVRLKSEEKTDRCRLDFCYAQYIFGEESVLDEILGYLQNEDYQIRCSSLSLLKEIVDENNRDRIKKVLEELLMTEATVAVKDSAVILLNECDEYDM